MTREGEERIINKIVQMAEAEVNKITSEAQAKAEEIRKEAKLKAHSEAQDVINHGTQEAKTENKES